jgi:hypothetical protein
MEWISVNDRLPEPLETVWITNGKYVNLGCLVDYEVGCEPDGLDVTHWHPVPSMEMFNRCEAQKEE